MKVILYAVRRGHVGKKVNDWEWYVSLDLSVDVWYWSSVVDQTIHFDPFSLLSKRDQGILDHEVQQLKATEPQSHVHLQMVRIVPDLSLGVAMFLRQKLSEVHLSQTNTTNSTLMEKWLKCIHRNIKSLYINDVPPQPFEIQHVHFPQCSQPTEPKLEIDTLNSLSRALQGRALLIDELLYLYRSTDPTTEGRSQQHSNHISNDWRPYIQILYLLDEIEISGSVDCIAKRRMKLLNKGVHFRCRRCGSDEEQMYWSYCIFCDQVCPYCVACLNMGQSRFCALLIHGTNKNISKPTLSSIQHQTTPMKSIQKWNLSPAQTEATRAGLSFLQESVKSELNTDQNATRKRQEHIPPSFLIWAVTGAGKTEMTFPLIDSELSRNGKVLLATPRKDVVIELQPRIKKAFPNQRVVTLYGGSSDRWEDGHITLATTHQLMRFWRKFDLIIIDELDAFPFHNNPILEYAVQKACSPTGRYILLTATPPSDMQKAIRTHQLPYVKVPVRFHRYPLPVPIRVKKTALHSAIRSSLERGAQIFLFVPKIKMIPTLLASLRELFSEIRVEGTSSKDPDRSIKVQQFREGRIRLLITTTIMERGVTVPKVDVFVYDADSKLFDEVALVQMAGRSGRASSDPQGRVYFFAVHKTKGQVKAIKQIQQMNRLAKKLGYLKRIN